MLSIPQASVEAGGRKIVTITFNPPHSAIDSGVVETSTNVRNLFTCVCVCVCLYIICQCICMCTIMLFVCL